MYKEKNVGLFNRIKCPNCHKSYDVRMKKSGRQLFCKHCGNYIKITSHNCNYYIEYYCESKRIREKIGNSKILAENVLRKRKVEIAESKFLDIKKELNVKFDDFIEQYYENHCKVNHRSLEKCADVHVKLLKRYFSGKCLQEITPLVIEKFKAERLKEVSTSTVNRSLSFLKAMFYKAINWGQFEGVNPVSKIKYYKENNKNLRFLEKHEINRILQFCKGSIGGIIIIALNTGMRRGEIFNLKWRDIDFKRDIISLLKTKSGDKRMIPINEFLKNKLISIRKHPKSEYVFCKQDGQPYKDIRTQFNTVLRNAGISKMRFHDLRHTFASQLVMNGIDLNTVRELLGHADLKTTLIYSHLSQDHKKQAVNVLCSNRDTAWTFSDDAEKELKSPSFITV